ncbi:5'-methylthioadenosine/S-adenosylhomocysteine nucleosidase [Actinoplanes sp. LDG1-06]|uniref:5'-methylthioadenosine/S-adenosylhomocysteine nucleosidase n=1 Tax=Paractinoplanes ovalisporus TaxID=2810368 RepID=A0ABS2AKJ5_9ACTN|nr:5'-methylthioadenosine/S-adenosylhomocysteine nucleosidase [Actinoplanes ovalisporus]MBM2620298.1 5'-methylthioadenosine/S-adenosylhomocysteine nucleosidase [Actinoplanes ovalisporus]
MIRISGGFNNLGGTNSFHAPITVGEPDMDEPDTRRADIGVLTVIDEEIRAVVEVLRNLDGCRTRRLADGPMAYEACLPGHDGRPLRIAAVQTLTRGTDSAALACRGLIDAYHPATVLLVGIAGGVNPKVQVGDVVLGDSVISYDARRETAEGTRRRGQTQVVSAAVTHRLNEFFRDRPARGFGIHRGPIGSGNAVVTDARSEIRHWLRDVNEKVMAVETEAAGVAQAFHETALRAGHPVGWLPVRGISDTADEHKTHSHHDLAARNAAATMALLAPYLDFR